MSTTKAEPNLTYRAGATSETLIHTGRCRLYAIIPDAVTVGTVTLRDGAAADGAGTTVGIMAIGVLTAGKNYQGALFQNGLTVQASSASDVFAVVWEAV